MILLTFSELSSKPFIQRAVSNPMKPASVLSYFFGVDYDDTPVYKDKMINDAGTVFDEMQRFWFMQSDEYDAFCQPFVPVVRAAGNRQLLDDGDEDWNGSVDGIMSQVILCDQLSRNCFRGANEAYQYDSVAEELSLRLIDDYYTKLLQGQSSNNNDNDDNPQCAPSSTLLAGDDDNYYAPYIAFMTLPLMHSEKIASHEKGLDVLNGAIAKYEDDPGTKIPLELTKSSLLEHKAVIDKFGRYPHRNGKLGRESTPEEQAWLDDIENLPGWAKSQL